MIAFQPHIYPEPKRLSTGKRMTIAAGMLCDDGVVFGADTDESVGDMRRRVHKIPTLRSPRAMITGTCQNASLMDAAVHRIFEQLAEGNAKHAKAVEELLDRVLVGLYRREFKAYPDQSSMGMKLLVAVKPEDDSKVSAWIADCSVVFPMRRVQIVGYGELVQSVADHLYLDGMSTESAVVAMVQVLSAAKKRVQFVGGESYVHVLHNDGAMAATNFSFSPEKEDLYDFFMVHGRELLLATGTRTITNEQYDRLAAKFIEQLKWKRGIICR